MIDTIIIEDEINARGVLKKMIALIDNRVNIIAETGYVRDGIKLINDKKPKLVFLDIQLEDGIGFDILKRLDTLDFKVIFTTAYDEYALKAFKYSATDYLLKPINPIELGGALERAIEDIEKEQLQNELLNVLKHNIDNNDDKKIVLKTLNNQHIVSTKDIIRLEADSAYTIFNTTTDKIVVSKNLKYYQDILGDSFVRCHQSHLVNKIHITGITKKQFITMTNTDVIPISTRKKTEIIKEIKSK